MWKSSSDRYGRVAITIHWVSAALIIGLMIAGNRASGMTDLEAKASLLRIHAPIGTAVLVLTMARLSWWFFADEKPHDPAGMPHLQALAARAVHGLLYVTILGLAGSGIAMIALSGASDILFGSAPGTLPDFWKFAPRYGHAAMAWAMVALLVAHVGAALYHQFILKDRLFARMGVGK
jgi:cytochrome b561